MSGTLTREDIVDGIRDVITRLGEAGRTATIQIVGGAAIALTVDGNRASGIGHRASTSTAPSRLEKSLKRWLSRSRGSEAGRSTG